MVCDKESEARAHIVTALHRFKVPFQKINKTVDIRTYLTKKFNLLEGDKGSVLQKIGNDM